MGQPAAVMGDTIDGVCAGHQVPNPGSGAPQPGPPMPFSAPILQSCATTVQVAGKPAALMGSSGVNTPPHVGLHLSDPFAVPVAQQGRVVSASTSVLVEGRGVARTGDQGQICIGTGTVNGTATTVLIGG